MADRAGRWVRVSGDSQSEADQLPDIDAYCDDKGYIKGKLYVVHGKSAYKGAQDPFWQEVVKDLKDDVIDLAVCWMVDRLDRKNILHAIPMALKVLDADGRIEFSEQPECNLDAKSPTIDDEVKAFSDRIHAANQESKIKSKRVLKAHRKRRAAGSAIGRATWGYEIICDVCKETPLKPRCRDHKKLFVPTSDGRKYIPLIFGMVIDGYSLRDIAAWLTAEKVPTVNGKPWNELAETPACETRRFWRLSAVSATVRSAKGAPTASRLCIAFTAATARTGSLITDAPATARSAKAAAL